MENVQSAEWKSMNYDEEILKCLREGKCPWCNLGRGPCTSGFYTLPKTYKIKVIV